MCMILYVKNKINKIFISFYANHIGNLVVNIFHNLPLTITHKKSRNFRFIWHFAPHCLSIQVIKYAHRSQKSASFWPQEEANLRVAGLRPSCSLYVACSNWGGIFNGITFQHTSNGLRYFTMITAIHENIILLCLLKRKPYWQNRVINDRDRRQCQNVKAIENNYTNLN